MEPIYLSKDGYEKLDKELAYLKSVKRKEFSLAIEEARLKGDLRENAEYDAAKEASAYNEKKIAELESTLSHAQLLEREVLDKDVVLIGARVKLQDMDTNEKCEYFFVSNQEADYEQGKISIHSPIGKGLGGHRVGEIIDIKIPAGILRYKILQISR